MSEAAGHITLRCNPDETGVHFRERRGTVHYDQDGIPIVLELRCKNRECCPRRNGFYAVHLFTLYGVQNGKPVGQYVTREIPFRDVADMPLGIRIVGGNSRNVRE